MDILGLLPSFGSLLYTFAAFVVALSIIVAVHEYGHYIIGRLSGIKAEVFSLGFGPVLFGRTDRHGTRWQIAALPFGGYVKFLGDANAASAGADEETMRHLTVAEQRHTMHGAPLWARAATVAAGPVFNFVLSAALFAGIFMLTGFATDRPTVGQAYDLPATTAGFQTGDQILEVNGLATPDYSALRDAAEPLPGQQGYDYRVLRDGTEVEVSGPAPFPTRVASVAPDSAAMAAGLRKGDVITAVNGTPVASFSQLQAVVNTGDGTPAALTIWRAGESFEVTLTPKRTDLPTADGGFETRWLVGIGGDFFFEPVTRSVGPVEALREGMSEVGRVIGSSLSALSHIVTGSISSCNLRGPLGIAQTSGAAASQGMTSFIWFVAVLSTAVGLMNLFPIPVLDGGHLVFHAWEWAAGRPPSERLVGVLMTAGLTIVLALMAFGLTNDLRC